MKTIKLITVVALLLSAGCEKPKPKIPKQREVLPESRTKEGKLTRTAVTWISDGSPEQIQWIHDHCANVDPIPVECIPFMSTASPTPTMTASATPTATAPSVSPTATATTTPSATLAPTATAAPTLTPTPPVITPAPTVTLCTVPNLIGTKIKDAQAAWNRAGFTTTVIVTSGAPGHQVTTQSMPAGSHSGCDNTIIKVGAQ